MGQGQCVLVKMDDRFILIDGGGRASSSFVVSYLKKLNINKLDCIAVSHYDEDHMSGIIGVLNVFSCDTLLVPGYAGGGELYQSLAVAALSNGCCILHPSIGTTFEEGNGIVEVIGPVRNDYPTDNDMSLCFRLGYDNVHCLVCGDAEQSSEIDMVNSGLDLSGEIYIVDHHGSSTSSIDAFLDEIKPSYAVISCGRENSYGHPAIETMQRLQNHDVSIFRTDDQGTVVAYSDGIDLWFSTSPSDNRSSGSGSVLFFDDSVPDSNDETISREIPEQTDKEQNDEYRYVCNTNTKKFHYPDCKSVSKMKSENRLFTNMSREELLTEGYEPCGNCNP